MRLSISNIAWDVSEDEAIAQLLHQYKIDAIDIAPSKYFPNPTQTTDDEILSVKNWWLDHHIEIIGMQSLLFGTVGLNVFGDSKSQQALLSHLNAVCRIASRLGASKLVFGSPKNRDRNGLTDEQTLSIAIPFFRELGNIAQSHGVTINLEPNPAAYGANFMTDSVQTAQVVTQVDHPAIQMQLDTGALTMNKEDAAYIIKQYAHLIAHIHASEPHLMPIGDGQTQHAQIAEVLSRLLPLHPVTIEMVATKDEPHLSSVERALQCATHHYQNI